MASSRDTQNGPDWTDIQSVLLELEQDYECRIVMEQRLVRKRGGIELQACVTAYPWVSVSGEVRPSVSLSAIIDRSGCALGVAVIFRLLHTLAYELGKKATQKQV